MTVEDARRLLALSRQARWTFPSSSGRPISHDPCEWVKPLLAEKTSFVEAARALSEAGDSGAATEIAANTWRLWILSRDIAAGVDPADEDQAEIRWLREQMARRPEGDDHP